MDYLEEHYNNVQAAFKNFYQKAHSVRVHGTDEQKKKYDMINVFLSDDWNYGLLLNEIQNHDLSKLSEQEFIQYRKYFHSIDEKEKEQSKELFENAWEHHQKANAHHWQHRNFENYKPVEIAQEHFINIIHNVLDWIAMAYKFNESPLRSYYLKSKHEMQMSEQDFKDIELIFDLFDEV